MKIGAITHVRLGGGIDETFSAGAVMANAAGHVLIDLGTLERISSFGVRNWIEFVSKLPPNVTSLSIIHAPAIVVDQFNMVEGFGGIAQLLSVLGPYFCPTCQEDRTRLIDVEAHRETIAAGNVPEQRCHACSSPLEFTEMASEFFDFMRTQRAAQIDPLVQRYLRTVYLNEVADAGAQLKLVQDDLTYIRLGGKIGPELNVRRLSAGLEGRVIFDLGAMTEIVPAGMNKLLEVLSRASAGATVVLWRAPLSVLAALKASPKPIPVSVGSIWLSLTCGSCGSSVADRITSTATEFQDTPPTRQCHVCGGSASIAESDWSVLIASLPEHGLDPATLETVDQLERRALSHYLTGGTNPEHTPTRPGGEVSTNKFQIIRRLGQGGMAEVFLARQVGVKGFEKYVVVKRILNQFAESPDFVEMLFAEARANARLTHPNIVQTYDAGLMEGNVAFIAMEYVRGPDIKRLIVELRKRNIKMPLEHSLRIVAETANGLHYAHAYVDPTGKPHPMVHRDVSPHNVLLSLDGAIKLSDFGIAKVQGEEHTQAGVLKGKIAYISPEAISGLPLDGRNDVFALGVMMYEMLIGQLPFRRENDAATLRAILREPPRNPTEIDPTIPQDVSNLVLWALEKDVNRRIPTAARLRDEIESAMVRNRMSSSAAAVAQFVREALGEALAAYGPVAAASGATPSKPGLPTDASPVPSFSDAPRANAAPPLKAPAPVPSMAAAAANGQSVVIELSELDQVPEAVAEIDDDTATSFTPPPPGVFAQPPPAASFSVPAPQAPRPLAGSHTTSPAIAEIPPAVAVAAPAPPPQQRPAPRPAAAPAPQPKPFAAPPPQAAKPPPPAPVAKPAPTPPAPAPVVAKPAPAPAPAAKPAPAPPKPAAKPAVTAPPQPPPAPATAPGVGGRKWVGAAVAVGVLLLAGGLGVTAMSLDGGGDRTIVLNLEPSENLYVGGVRVDAAKFLLPKDATSIVSIGAGGKLQRFGTASGRTLDARALVAAQVGSEDKATVYIHGSTSGCVVRLSGEPLPSLTPTQTTINAGQETQLEVECPSEPKWSGWVLGLPRQEIKVAAKN